MHRRIQVYRDDRPFDLALAGEEEDARHDEAQAERHQRIGNDRAERDQLVDDQCDDGT